MYITPISPIRRPTDRPTDPPPYLLGEAEKLDQKLGYKEQAEHKIYDFVPFIGAKLPRIGRLQFGKSKARQRKSSTGTVDTISTTVDTEPQGEKLPVAATLAEEGSTKGGKRKNNSNSTPTKKKTAYWTTYWS